MSKEMIISVNGRERKIAIIENGKVSEYYIERGEENSGIAGNIYKGRVQRVLPGMQSAFVAIGLERDAFLYVSDFFDEEEEIERIVMEKGKKGSQHEAKREANDRIERARAEREKQMESAQEIAEPLGETAEPKDEEASEPTAERKGRGRRDRKDRRERPHEAEAVEARESAEEEDLGYVDASEVEIEIDDTGFERIVDEDAETGEMFKDAYMQEAIVDRVRAVEFDMESTDEAEVGSLLDDLTADAPGFERIADEDEEEIPAAKAKPAARSRAKKGTKKNAGDAGEAAEAAAEKEEKPKKRTSRTTKTAKAKDEKEKPAKARSTRSKKNASTSDEPLEDAEASIKAPEEKAEMAVRRGGRGRRRGGRPKGQEADGKSSDLLGFEDVDPERDVPAENTRSAADDHTDDAPANDKAERKSTDIQTEGDPTDASLGQDRNGRSRRRRGRGRGQQRDDGPQDNTTDSRPSRPDRPERSDRGDKGDRRQPTISDLLREGQEVLVQIAKEPIAKKGARITSHIALPGRFLVYMPTVEHLGVSRKIESSSERGRLRTLIQRIKAEEDVPTGGFIVRTAGIGISEEDLRQDARYLVRTWLDIKKASEKAKSPALVHQDLDIIQRLLRDQLSDDFTAIRVDSEEEYLRTVEFINRIQPKMVNRVKLYTRDQPILEAYGVQEEIDKALKPRVWLKSGGYLVINQTEALVAIDVNTGKFVGKGNARLEDTITKTNMEAVDEIARQIRLRDLGGIIVLDLIDMEDRRNRHKVSQALQAALASDKSPTKVLSFNDFGLIIMTRKRVKQSLERTMCSPCEYCEGAGWVKSPQTVCYEILAEARRLSKEMDDVRETALRVHPEVANALRTTERSVLEEIEAYLGYVDLTSDPHVHQAQFDFAFI
ncbi:MAG: Rne/Rng family ribonuclease [Acidobacteria bacterium]|nr:Rne/Rng family ribonuclease [Acidobacteriota bacterium]